MFQLQPLNNLSDVVGFVCFFSPVLFWFKIAIVVSFLLY